MQELQGKDLQANPLTERLCGTKIPDPVHTEYSHLEILFCSDAFVEKSGFKFYFTRSDNPTNADNELNRASSLHHTKVFFAGNHNVCPCTCIFPSLTETTRTFFFRWVFSRAHQQVLPAHACVEHVAHLGACRAHALCKCSRKERLQDAV